MGYVPIFEVLKLFQVVCFNDMSMAFRCPVLAPNTASVNGFCIILVLVPVTVSEIIIIIIIIYFALPSYDTVFTAFVMPLYAV